MPKSTKRKQGAEPGARTAPASLGDSQSESDLRSLIADMPEGMVVLSGSTVALANDAFREITGYDPSRVADNGPFASVLPEDRPMVQARALARQRGEPVPPEYEFRVRRLDGTVGHVHVRARPTTFQGKPASLAVVRDVTERHRLEEVERARSHELEAFFTTARTLVEDGSFDEKAHKLLFEVCNMVGSEYASLWIPEPQAQRLVPLATVNDGKRSLSAVSRIDFDQGITGAAYRDGETVLSDDYASEPRAIPVIVKGGHFGSTVSLPIIVNDRTVGVVTTPSVESGHFTPQRVQLLEGMVDAVGSLMDNARLQELERSRSSELEATFNIANILVQPVDFRTKATQMLEELVRVGHADRAAVYVPEEDGKTLNLVALVGDVVTEGPPGGRLPPGSGVSFTAFHEGHVIVANDYPNHPARTDQLVQAGVRSLVAVPIISGDHVLGVVNLASVNEDTFPPDRVRMLTAVVGSVGAVIENGRLAAAEHVRTRELAELNRQLSVDIDKRKAAEKALKRSERRAVKALGDLRMAQEVLVQTEKLSALGELVAGVAHELNNPLTSVVGFSTLLLEDTVPSKRRRHAELVAQEAQRAAQIVHNLLRFARKDEGVRTRVAVNDAVAETVELRSYTLKHSGYALKVDLDASNPSIEADHGELQSVLLNLMNNAVDAMVGSGQGSTVTVATKQVRRGVRITVSDDGPGMPQSVSRRAFDPFVTTKEIGKGTGLGLSICHGIVRSYGGTIVFDTKLGRGTTFKLEFPAAALETGAEAGLSLPASPVSRGTVLVVDDERYVRELLHELLSGVGYHVVLSETPAEGLRLAKTAKHDVILLDIKMPDMSGREFYEALKSLDETLASNVVFLTGDSVSGDTRAFLKRTARKVISKPFEPGHLLNVVGGVVDAAQRDDAANLKARSGPRRRWAA